MTMQEPMRDYYLLRIVVEIKSVSENASWNTKTQWGLLHRKTTETLI